MRRKIKELMNREEGFTLVELLAVIVILGLIIAIAVPSIGRIMDDANTNTDNANEVLIKDAARLYSVDNDIPTAGVHTDTLESEGFLDMRDTPTPGVVTYVDGQYIFTAGAADPDL